MQEFCVQIRRSCLAECHKKEDEYQDTIADYAMNMSRAERIRIRRTFAVDFLQDEENSRGGRIIRDCVTERGVSPAWTVFEGNRKFWNDPLLFKYCVEEMAKPTALELLVERVRECPLQWISPEHRVLFYHTCLKKYNINSFRKRSISSMRKLEKIAFVQKAETEKKGSIAIGAGSAQIAGGVLAGIRHCSGAHLCRSKLDIESHWIRNCLGWINFHSFLTKNHWRERKRIEEIEEWCRRTLHVAPVFYTKFSRTKRVPPRSENAPNCRGSEK